MVDYKMAMEYYRKGLALSVKDSLLQARLYANIANTFVQQKKLDSVLIYYYKSADYHKLHQNHRYLSIIYGNIALFYFRQGNGVEVRKNINLSLEAAQRSKDPYQIASVYQTMGSLAYNQHPAMAMKNFAMSLELAEKNKSFDQIRVCLENLSYLSQQKGNTKAAIDYLQRIVALDDSLDLVQKKDRIKQMELEHLASVRSAEELIKSQQLELKQIKEKNRQRFILILLLIGFGTLLTLFFMGVYNYRMKMKVTRTKERFVSMIAHDIRNPFSGILGLSGILVEEADKNDDLVQRKQVRALNQSLHQVYDLLENMLQWSHSESGKISFNPKVQPLSPLVQDAISLHAQTSKQKGIALENQIQSGLTARYDSNMLQTVIRNLLSNALKFSQENSTIFVSAEVVGKAVVVKVRDQGIGMSQEQLERVFKDEIRTSTMGTRNEIGSGLGLTICKDFISRHGGKIWAESKLHEGTTMFFTLPDQPRRF
jgi:signal transduction histidine kinase